MLLGEGEQTGLRACHTISWPILISLNFQMRNLVVNNLFVVHKHF